MSVKLTREDCQNKAKNDMKIVKNSNKKNKKNCDEGQEKGNAAIKNEKKTVICIEDLKNYAEKIKNINFDNVKLKKRKKRYGKNMAEEDKDTITAVTNQKNNNEIIVNNFFNEEKKPFTPQADDIEKPPKKVLPIRNSFNEVSSIIKEMNQNQQESSYENLDDFLKNLDNFPLNFPNENLAKKGIVTDREMPFFANHNNEKREVSQEKANKFSIQNLDVAREKVRCFKTQLNCLLDNLTNGEITEKIRLEIKGLVQDFSQNRYIISQNDKGILIKLQTLLEEKDDVFTLEKSRSSSNPPLKSLLFPTHNSNPPPNQGAPKKISSEVIEESLNDSDLDPSEFSQKNSSAAVKLRSKVTPGHFSKLNRNYAENLVVCGKSKNQRSKEKLYSDIQ